MTRAYDPNFGANITIDPRDQIRGVSYVDEYPAAEKLRGREAAATHLRELSPNLGIGAETLRGMDQPVGYHDPRDQKTEYRFGDEKANFDTTTYGWRQTYLNVPVWGAGLTATLKHGPARVLAATNTSEGDIDAKLPSAKAIERFRELFRTGEKVDPELLAPAKTAEEAKARQAKAAEPIGLAEVLGAEAKGATTGKTAAKLIRGRFYVHRYDPRTRLDDFPQEHDHTNGEIPRLTAAGAHVDAHPTLPLPEVPTSIRPGHWYLVAELILRAPWNGQPINWRALVEVETGAVLYLRGLTSNVNGLVFDRDPITTSGNAANGPSANNATLSAAALRTSVTLPGLTAPGPGLEQALSGNFVRISDFEQATVAPPTRPVGSNFDYDSRTNNFAAVSAYYHCDRFFRLCEDLGFTISSYFGGTTFPIPVDHRGRYGTTDGIERNASCSGDGDGIASVDFELADMGDLANPIGIAADWRVVLHELGGHGILYDHVNTANFGFAHSAGDSLAVILNDPETAATDRFESYPWVSFIGRRHDRTVAAGWGWGGASDIGGYASEQILATSHFRAYRSIGGDSPDLGRRKFAARCMAYLILRAVGTLTPASNPASAALFLDALLAADAGDWTSEGLYGGAYGKVLTWAFEKQNLNGGAPPAVDVYIDDGRSGEYLPYLPVHWATTTIWNRRSADGLAGHQEPALDETNYAYVKVRNRGTSPASNVVVKAYHCKPSAGVLWPNDLQPMTTPQLAVGSLAANDTEEKIVGPFSWTPVTNTWGHDCMLMIVSATGDPSNVDKFTAGEVVQDWRLVPNDNNVAQRNVTLVPGGGGVRGLMAGLHGKGFWVGNPQRVSALVEVSVSLPPLLARRGWRVEVKGLPAEGARLKPGEQRAVTFDVQAGAAFTASDAAEAGERDIVVTARAGGEVIGGMVYKIDPDIETPFNEGKGERKSDACVEQAARLLDCLDLPGEDLKSVKVRRITIDLEMKDKGGCC